MSIAKHRDPSYLQTEVAFQAQQISSVSSDTNGASINLQNLGMPDAVKFDISFNSADNSDDIDFQVQTSSDNSSWSDVPGANAEGLSGNNADAEIEIRNLQSQNQYIRLILDSANSTLSGASFEVAAFAVFVGAKEV